MSTRTCTSKIEGHVPESRAVVFVQHAGSFLSAMRSYAYGWCIANTARPRSDKALSRTAVGVRSQVAGSTDWGIGACCL
ncbi:Uncharacterised protein [Mycobacteroides abscessus subsp. abscessus]|nr:Uncharacterised protein [Mycobacteroides abscessus subsp. abscessus]